MSEALASVDSEFFLTESSLSPKRPRGRAPDANGRGTRRGISPTRPIRYWLAAGVCVAAAVGILVNALVLQDARHPAPLFARSVPLTPAAAPKTAVSVPVPAPRPSLDQSGRTQVEASEAVPMRMPAQARVERQDGEEATDAKSAKDDPIARLIAGEIPQAGRNSSAISSETVFAVQKALAKLGFAVTVDGIAGPETREAIRRYERDRGLTPKGELTPKIIGRLSAESGIAIE